MDVDNQPGGTPAKVRKGRLLEACAKSRRGGETGVSLPFSYPRGSGLAATAQPDPGRAGGISVCVHMHQKVRLGDAPLRCYGIAEQGIRP